MRQSTNEHVERAYRRMARIYDRQARVVERLMFAGVRDWATSQAVGDVLEVAVGTGLNLPHYPPGIRLVGVDLSEPMLAIARRRAAELELGDRAELRQGDVQQLDLPDACVDTVVSTFALCTIPDPAAAAREAFRVLRPTGHMVLVEHGPAAKQWMLAGQRAWERIMFRFDADHVTRDPVPYLTAAGFHIDDIQRSKAGILFRIIASKPAIG